MYQNVIKDWHVPDSYPIDARGTAYSLAFFSAKHLGESQYYLLTGKDKDGNALEGNANYRLNVPANVPVTQYWSMTVYSRDTPSSRIPVGLADRRRLQDYKRTPMALWTFTSARLLRPGVNRTGFLLIPMAASRSWPASMVLKNLYSTRLGRCLTYRKEIRERLLKQENFYFCYFILYNLGSDLHK